MTDREKKAVALETLRRRYDEQRKQVEGIEARLAWYFEDICEHSDGDDDRHNYYEVLGAIRFLRLLRVYEFDQKKFERVLKMREGEWRKKGSMWVHVSGGLTCPGTNGPTVYRWQPFQVFVLASVFGFYKWVNTRIPVGTREMLPTERAGRNGVNGLNGVDGMNENEGRPRSVALKDDGDKMIWDRRRLCTDFTFFGPRKTDKTGLSAYIQFVFFFLEDNNAECYCCANSADQAKLLYRRTKQLLSQLDDGHRIRMTETVCDWRQAWKSVRDSSVRPLSAGGKTKDGMYAQLVCADEFGSAPYVNGKSDMKMLVDVIQSSMGPRREPLTFTTTTAGRITNGPFIEKLEALHRMLEEEGRPSPCPSLVGRGVKCDGDEAVRMMGSGDATAYGTDGCEMKEGDRMNGGMMDEMKEGDRMLCLCLEPDAWERDEDVLLTDRRVRGKVNPMLGVIVQHAFYDDEIAKARMTGDLGEVSSKLFNVYASQRRETWIKPTEVAALQVTARIDDLKADDGWIVFCGMDFSQGDDLHTAGYLCVNTRQEYSGPRYFCDFDAWVSEETLEKISIRPMYERWIADGWLRVSPGKVFQPSLLVRRVMELTDHLLFVSFGYDPYQSTQVVNDLSAWLVSLGGDPKQMVLPVRQNFASYNPVVDQFTYMVKTAEPWIRFSANPMWPWLFGNVALAESADGMGNKKPVKQTQSDSCKVDPIQCVLSGLMLYNIADGR